MTVLWDATWMRSAPEMWALPVFWELLWWCDECGWNTTEDVNVHVYSYQEMEWY
jgi:hypothetical protein